MAKEKFSTFVMGETTRDQIRALPQEMQLKFFWAVTDFGIDGIEPNFDGLELAIWIPMRDLIFNSKRQDEAWRAKQRENGKKGGRPRNKPAEETQKTQAFSEETQKTQAFSEETQKTQAFSGKNPETHNDNDNSNEKNKDKEKESDSVFFDKNPPPDPPMRPPDDKPPGAGPPNDKPIETKEDAVTIWNKARDFWNEKGLKPVCRDLMMRAGDTAEILRTFQFYSWVEIKNAIGNYAWHKFQAGSEYRPPPPYGSLAGFLKTGVEKYYDDDSLDQQFKEDRS